MNPLASWSSITIGVEDLAAARDFWVENLGFDVVRSLDGSDPATESLWGLNPGDIARQVIMSSSELQTGCLHLVEFVNPDSPVRQGANNFDLVPKNLDVYVHDLPAKVQGLKTKGYKFRTPEHTELTAPDGTRFREIHWPIHDHINLVLLEIVDKPMPFNRAGFCGVGPLVITSRDAVAEAEFFKSMFGLDLLSENHFSGPEIEAAIGLPQGTSLHILICGDPDHDFGKLEIVEYQGVQGEDLYSRAVPKALGLLHINYQLDDSDQFKAISSRLTPLAPGFLSNAPQFSQCEPASMLLGEGSVLHLSSPSGLRSFIYAPI